MISTLVPNYHLHCMISNIESACPGWWWSISQRQDEVTINMGPGRNGPHPQDLDYALTTEGDLGSLVTIVKDEDSDRKDEDSSFAFRAKVSAEFVNHVTSFNTVRGLDNSALPKIHQPDNRNYRHQTSDQLQALSDIYSKLMEVELPFFEKHGYFVKEVYIGSCDPSADCSLRGHDANGNEFDIAVDLQEDGTIAESMGHCITELKNEILTNQFTE